MKFEHSDVIIVIGANPTENHPVAATFFKNAVKNGSKLIVMDPRGQALRKHATHMLQFKLWIRCSFIKFNNECYY